MQNKRSSMYPVVVLLCLLGFVGFIDQPVLGQCSERSSTTSVTVKQKQLPISVDLSGSQSQQKNWKQTSILFNLCVETYHQPYKNFASKGGSDLINVFSKLIQAIQENNHELAYDLQNTSKDGTTAISKKGLKTYIKLMNKFYEDMITSSNILYIFNGGEIRYVILKLPKRHKNGELIFALRFHQQEDQWYWYPSFGDYTSEIIASSIDYHIRNTSGEQKAPFVDQNEREFSITNSHNGIKITFSGTSYERLTLLQLSEREIQQRQITKPLETYTKALQALKGKGIEAYSSFFSDGLKNRFVAWKKDAGEKALKKFRRKMINSGIFVEFLMNADPLYIVFYRKKKSPGMTDHLYYTILSKKNSGYVIQNTGSDGFSGGTLFEQFLLRDWFQNELKRIIQNERSGSDE